MIAINCSSNSYFFSTTSNFLMLEIVCDYLLSNHFPKFLSTQIVSAIFAIFRSRFAWALLDFLFAFSELYKKFSFSPSWYGSNFINFAKWSIECENYWNFSGLFCTARHKLEFSSFLRSSRCKFHRAVERPSRTSAQKSERGHSFWR